MVPYHAQVIPGAGVSIVLKQDQPTGRQVQGTVQTVLTKGDHPRGIKVRLSDGRVGRVQRMLLAPPSSTLSSTAATTCEHTVNLPFEVQSTLPPAAQSFQKTKYRDARLDGDLEAPPATNDLAAYIKPARQKKGKRGKAQSSVDVADVTGPMSNASCPVCHDFTGDEAAVAHHVQSHFD